MRNAFLTLVLTVVALTAISTATIAQEGIPPKPALTRARRTHPMRDVIFQVDRFGETHMYIRHFLLTPELSVTGYSRKMPFDLPAEKRSCLRQVFG